MFTDDDLRRLKEEMNPEGFTSNEAVVALIARLEAAERYCQTNVYKDRIAWLVSKGELTGKIRLMNGRKACGK